MARTRRRPAWGKLAALALIVALLAAAWRWTPLAEIVTAENIVAWTRSVRATWWAPLLMVAAYTPAAFILLPRPLLTLVAVLTFGALLGVVYGTVGILLAALVTYAAGRAVPRARLERLAGDAYEPAAKLLRSHGIVAVFGANMLPTPPFAVQNMIAGAARVRLWRFMLGTFLALVPGIIAWTVFGDQLANALEDPSKVSYPAIAATLVVLTAFVFLARRWLRKRGF